MSNTRKAAGVPSDRQAPTPVSGWKKAGEMLTLPSGNTIQLKNPGIMGLAKNGVVPNGLMATIMMSIQTGQEPTAEKLMENVDVADMFAMMSNAIILMAVDPEVYPTPSEGEERDPALLYIDDISEEDQMFIWQWATGGTADVEQFRRESASSMGALPGLPAVASPTKRAPARRR